MVNIWWDNEFWFLGTAKLYKFKFLVRQYMNAGLYLLKHTFWNLKPYFLNNIFSPKVSAQKVFFFFQNHFFLTRKIVVHQSAFQLICYFAPPTSPLPWSAGTYSGSLGSDFRFLPAGPTSDHHMTHFPGVVINKMSLCDGSMSLCFRKRTVR